MIRWNYIALRLGIALLLLMAILMGLNPLVSWVLVHFGQSITGAKVEIGLVRASLWHGQIELLDLEIADPRDPMRNLIQADRAVVRLDVRHATDRVRCLG